MPETKTRLEMHLHATCTVNKHPFQLVTAEANYPKRITNNEVAVEEDEPTRKNKNKKKRDNMMLRVTTVPAMKTLFWRRLEIQLRKIRAEMKYSQLADSPVGLKSKRFAFGILLAHENRFSRAKTISKTNFFDFNPTGEPAGRLK